MKKIGKNVKLYLIGMIIGGMTLGLTTVIADTIINSTNVSYKTSTVKAALDDLYGLTADDIWKKIYPIGSIYTSVSPTSPATLFGGTWERFGKGKTLVSVDEDDSDFNASEKAGGSKTKTIAVGNLPAHTHSVNAFNTGNTGGGQGHTHGVSNTSTTRTSNANNRGHTHTTYAATTANVSPGSGYKIPWSGGSNQGVRNTSGENQNHTHTYADYYANTTSGSTTLTVNQIPSHSHSVPAHNTNSTGGGTALNTQDPYITVYMWKRTA